MNLRSLEPEEIFAHAKRAGVVMEANRLMLAFYIDRDPAWILKACETARRAGLVPPANWLKSEEWAKGRRSATRRGPRANALTIAKLLELAAILWYRPSPGEPFGRRVSGDILDALARECGMSKTHVRKLLSIYGRRRLGRGLRPGGRHEDPARPRSRKG